MRLVLDRAVQQKQFSETGRADCHADDSHTQDRAFQAALEQPADELKRALRERDHISIEQKSELMDEIQLATASELAICSMNSRYLRLLEVSAALDRIRDGSYGTCADSKGAISRWRLAAVPWASRSVECQSKVDCNG